jgi:hypothetical protein
LRRYIAEAGEEGEAHQHEHARKKLRRKVPKKKGGGGGGGGGGKKQDHFHAHLDANELAQAGASIVQFSAQRKHSSWDALGA